MEIKLKDFTIVFDVRLDENGEMYHSYWRKDEKECDEDYDTVSDLYNNPLPMEIEFFISPDMKEMEDTFTTKDLDEELGGVQLYSIGEPVGYLSNINDKVNGKAIRVEFFAWVDEYEKAVRKIKTFKKFGL